MSSNLGGKSKHLAATIGFSTFSLYCTSCLQFSLEYSVVPCLNAPSYLCIWTLTSILSMLLPSDRLQLQFERKRPLRVDRTSYFKRHLRDWIEGNPVQFFFIVTCLVFGPVLFFLRRRRRRRRIKYAGGCQTIPTHWITTSMPPVRGTVNTKGLKTERTHEENQERYAYCRLFCIVFAH